jgi:hypothetical protein
VTAFTSEPGCWKLMKVNHRGVCVIVTCPRCFRDDEVSWQRLPDRMIMYVCSDGHGGSGPHTWVASRELLLTQEAAADGVTDELLEPLRACVVPGEPFAEYGVVEYRLRVAYPELFRAHVRQQGHVLTGKRPFTASGVRFGVALSRLARTGELLSRYGPATGAWAYNGQMTYWAAPPEPSGVPLTWAAFCAQVGRSPEWTDEDRAAAV